MLLVPLGKDTFILLDMPLGLNNKLFTEIAYSKLCPIARVSTTSVSILEVLG